MLDHRTSADVNYVSSFQFGKELNSFFNFIFFSCN